VGKEENVLVRQLLAIIMNLPHSQYTNIPVSASFIASLFQQVDFPMVKKKKFKEEEKMNFFYSLDP
jgi:hypothetical protein